MTAQKENHIVVEDLEMAYGSLVIQRDVSFTVGRGKVFLVMGGSGCGKSTLLRHLTGLIEPARGRVIFDGTDFWSSPEEEQERLLHRMGVLFQGGALWSSLTVEENVALPLEQFAGLGGGELRDMVSYKLSLVGLEGYERFYPSEISGGMRKRAGLARAMALDPDILFFDEPSAGLDPVSARRLDDLILELRDSLGATVVVVTHELASIFAIGDDSVFLDAEEKTMIATGNPNELLDHSDNPKVREFLSRGQLK